MNPQEKAAGVWENPTAAKHTELVKIYVRIFDKQTDSCRQGVGHEEK